MRVLFGIGQSELIQKCKHKSHLPMPCEVAFGTCEKQHLGRLPNEETRH